ncbi:MAG: hypothetical protein KatS3mg129_2156 [Leptospiraceae bacterium]|nr:MAG: hypothetical protein KatS3mg129_2156 [Leptospiraceae bacterium]
MKKIYLTLVGLIAGISLIGISSLSAAPYGMAGCGLGSLIIKENNILQIFAATTNGTFGNQTFGITTGTSNCTPNSSAYQEKQQEIFVTVNFESLESEMAMGKGEKIMAFSQMLGCDSETFAKISKEKYKEFFSETTTPKELLQKVKTYTNKVCVKNI